MTVLRSLTPAAVEQLIRQARARVIYTAPSLLPNVAAAPIDAHPIVGGPTAYERRTP